MHGTAISELDLDARYGVTLTRVTRGEIEMTAVPTLRLQFGDVLQAVGPDEGISQAEAQLGNSMHALNETHFIPLFAGIAAGIALGTLPIKVPGLPQPLRLGLAGGPLIVAILVGRFGRIGRLVSHVPRSANLALREFGIALFFASVGLMAGPTFFSTVFSLSGLLWLVAGVCVTVLPLLTRRHLCPQDIWHELRDALGFDRRKHDRPAGTCLCQRNMPIGGAGSGLCDRVSIDDAATDHGCSNLGCRAVWIIERAA